MLSALLAHPLHQTFGQRGAAFLSPLCRIIAYILLSLHLPWPVIVVGLVICGFGNGITEAAWNAWLGGLERSNELLGLLHGMYGLGALLAPIIATGMVGRGYGWYEYYYIVLGTNALELVYGTAVFWRVDGKAFRERTRQEVEEQGATGGTTKEAAKSKVVWLIAVFFFLYVGVEGTLHPIPCSSSLF